MTVVVPAYNVGADLEPALASLRAQTLPSEQFEVVLIDDGSTDDTAARLDRFARDAPNARVVHLDPSGAPGRPRNVGIESARGAWILFLDADDELTPGALERLLAMAEEHQSDIVLGKYASETLPRRQDLFDRNRGKATLRTLPALVDASLAPNKLFRTEFLRAHDLRFTEGWRQLEDQLFVLQAYRSAAVISVVADELCYRFRRRASETHLSTEWIDAAAHVERLAAVIESATSGLDDAQLVDRIVSRLYKVEILARATGAAFVGATEEQRRAYVEAFASFAQRCVPDRIDRRLGALLRLRSRLIRDREVASLTELARHVDAITLQAAIVGAAWSGSALRLQVAGRLRDSRDVPILARANDTVLVDVGAIAAVRAAGADGMDVSDELGTVFGQVTLVDAATSAEWIVGKVPRRIAANGEIRIGGKVELDAGHLRPGGLPVAAGTLRLMLRWSGLGLRLAAPLQAAGDASLSLVRPAPGRRIALIAGPGDAAALEVAPFVAGSRAETTPIDELRWRVRRASSAIRTRARDAARRLPAPVQDVLRRLLARRSG